MSNATAIVTALGNCPIHGPQVFRRVEECNWWECPEAEMLEPTSCGSVIPAETVTPDGADVMHWRQSRWVPEGTAERRVWDQRVDPSWRA